MTDYDVPWKEVLDAYLNDFLQLCLPEIHDGIDWTSPIENHEQELPQLFPNSHASGRVADKLFRAKFKTSKQPTWFMIHTEVQVTRQAEFAQRMFTCYYRILDRFRSRWCALAFWEIVLSRGDLIPGKSTYLGASYDLSTLL